MNLVSTAFELKQLVKDAKKKRLSIGFVPTMGALHEGHLSLVKRALSETDIVIVSIFVNPTQFNNPNDLTNYPRTLEKDIALLNELGSIHIFAPSFEEIYPKNDSFAGIDLFGLDSVLEGKFRPGHFQGVVHVVHNLFQLTEANKAFFGLKDFQQVAVIKHMVKTLSIPVEIIACETTRSENGLALSSRNLRLNSKEKEDALIIFKTLSFIQSLTSSCSPKEAQKKGQEYFEQGNLTLEYLEIVDSVSLKSASEKWPESATCCIAAFCGEVRLIDNMQL